MFNNFFTNKILFIKHGDRILYIIDVTYYAFGLSLVGYIGKDSRLCVHPSNSHYVVANKFGWGFASLGDAYFNTNHLLIRP